MQTSAARESTVMFCAQSKLKTVVHEFLCNLLSVLHVLYTCTMSCMYILHVYSDFLFIFSLSCPPYPFPFHPYSFLVSHLFPSPITVDLPFHSPPTYIFFHTRYRISKASRTILKEKGIRFLFPIQYLTFDHIYDGKNVIGQARKCMQVMLSLYCEYWLLSSMLTFAESGGNTCTCTCTCTVGVVEKFPFRLRSTENCKKTVKTVMKRSRTVIQTVNKRILKQYLNGIKTANGSTT